MAQQGWLGPFEPVWPLSLVSFIKLSTSRPFHALFPAAATPLSHTMVSLNGFPRGSTADVPRTDGSERDRGARGLLSRVPRVHCDWDLAAFQLARNRLLWLSHNAVRLCGWAMGYSQWARERRHSRPTDEEGSCARTNVASPFTANQRSGAGAALAFVLFDVSKMELLTRFTRQSSDDAKKAVEDAAAKATATGNSLLEQASGVLSSVTEKVSQVYHSTGADGEHQRLGITSESTSSV